MEVTEVRPGQLPPREVVLDAALSRFEVRRAQRQAVDAAEFAVLQAAGHWADVRMIPPLAVVAADALAAAVAALSVARQAEVDGRDL